MEFILLLGTIFLQVFVICVICGLCINVVVFIYNHKIDIGDILYTIFLSLMAGFIVALFAGFMGILTVLADMKF